MLGQISQQSFTRIISILSCPSNYLCSVNDTQHYFFVQDHGYHSKGNGWLQKFLFQLPCPEEITFTIKTLCQWTLYPYSKVHTFIYSISWQVNIFCYITTCRIFIKEKIYLLWGNIVQRNIWHDKLAITKMSRKGKLHGECRLLLTLFTWDCTLQLFRCFDTSIFLFSWRIMASNNSQPVTMKNWCAYQLTVLVTKKIRSS